MLILTKNLFYIFILFVAVQEVSAETVTARLVISDVSTKEPIINRENLQAIKDFILENGWRQTYSSMYNNNPAFKTKNFYYYLNPDTGQANINCDIELSDFNNLRIALPGEGLDQHRNVKFEPSHPLQVWVAWPSDNLSVIDIREPTEQALSEILNVIDSDM